MLPGCLASVRGAVDAMVVVDTGSSDRTRELAAEAGAKVVELPWADDFAAPRNAALEHVKGGFILQLDADERLVEGAAAEIRRASKRQDFDVGMLRFHDAVSLDASPADVVAGRASLAAPYLCPRLLRRTPDLRYEGVIHEHVTRWFVRHGSRQRVLPVDVVHLGAVPSLVESRSKHARNVRLLEKRCASEPGDPTAWGYLAWDHLKAGELDAAARVIGSGWAMLPALAAAKGYRPSILRLAVARANLQERAVDGAGMMETADAATAYEGAHPDLTFLRGRGAELAALATGEEAARARLFAQARDGFAACLEARAKKTYAQNFVPHGGGYVGWTRLGTAHLALGAHADALAAFERALAEAPGHAEAVFGRLEAQVAGGAAARVLGEIEPLLGELPDGWVIAAQAALALGARADARVLLERAAVLARARPFAGLHRGRRLEALLRALG